MLKAKIAVLVSGGGTNLQALIDFEKKGLLKHGEISVVISNNPDAYALKRARENNIPTCIIANGPAFEDELSEILTVYKTDLIILAGFMKILSENFVSKYPARIINVHPSLIPSFCGKGYYGLKVHEEALKYGVKVTGATVHFVNEIPDGGQIIFQKAVKIRKNDTPETLQRHVMETAEWEILPKAAEKVSELIVKEGENYNGCI